MIPRRPFKIIAKYKTIQTHSLGIPIDRKLAQYGVLAEADCDKYPPWKMNDTERVFDSR